VELVATQATQTGTVNWTKQYLVAGYERPNSVAIKNTATGYYMVACLYLPALADFGYTVVIKTDKSGNVQWARRLGITGRNITTGAVERNGYLYLSMTSDSYTPNELMLVKMDPQGNIGNRCNFIQPISVTSRVMPIVQDARNYTVAPKILPDSYTGTVFGNPLPNQKMYCDTACKTPAVNITGNGSITRGSSVTLTAEGMAGDYSWSTGEQTQSIEVYAPGEYCVTVRGGGETAEDCFTVASDSDSDDGANGDPKSAKPAITVTSALKLSPNPASNIATLTMKKLTTANATVAINDQYGKRVYQGVVAAGTKRLDLSIAHLPAAIYTVTVFFADRTTATVKLVKQ
jgi:Secretion system C-terminal sorting domain